MLSLMIRVREHRRTLTDVSPYEPSTHQENRTILILYAECFRRGPFTSFLGDVGSPQVHEVATIPHGQLAQMDQGGKRKGLGSLTWSISVTPAPLRTK